MQVNRLVRWIVFGERRLLVSPLDSRWPGAAVKHLACIVNNYRPFHTALRFSANARAPSF
jgi:hypothetical protein